MMNYPDTFKKAREEIARVVGTERLVTFHDRSSLPYGVYPNLWHNYETFYYNVD